MAHSPQALIGLIASTLDNASTAVIARVVLPEAPTSAALLVTFVEWLHTTWIRIFSLRPMNNVTEFQPPTAPGLAPAANSTNFTTLTKI